VADDLLKNDGKKFIEMMEQLAERRMAREEDAKEQYNMNGYAHPNGTLGHHHSHHNHPPVPDDDLDYEEDEEDDEDYDSQDEDYDDEEMVGCCEIARFPLLIATGYHDRGAAHGGRTPNVSDIRCTYV
jgi:hypothetical protein